MPRNRPPIPEIFRRKAQDIMQMAQALGVRIGVRIGERSEEPINKTLLKRCKEIYLPERFCTLNFDPVRFAFLQGVQQGVRSVIKEVEFAEPEI